MSDRIPQHAMHRTKNAEYYGVQVFNVVDNYIEGEESNTYVQCETRELAEQWMKDVWGDDNVAHIETSLMVTLRVSK